MALSNLLLAASCGLSVLETEVMNLPDTISEGYYRFGENFSNKYEKKLSKDEIIEKILKLLTKYYAKLLVISDETGRITKKSAKLIAEGHILLLKDDLKEMKRKELKKFLNNLEDFDEAVSKDDLKNMVDDLQFDDLQDIIKFAVEFNEKKEEEVKQEETAEEEEETDPEEKEEEIKETLKDLNSPLSSPSKEKEKDKKEEKKVSASKKSSAKGRNPIARKVGKK